MVEVFSDSQCQLGEGPLWHPQRGELFWFDILSQCLHSADRRWDFDEPVSAAGWLDEQRLLIASASGLFSFDLETAERSQIAEMEADNPITRSNDGRVAPDGAFWIGTMGRALESEAGALYRYSAEGLKQIRSKVTIPNATAFSPDGAWMYFADTPQGTVKRWPMVDGLPQGKGEVFATITEGGPDGAVCDAQGGLWLAVWGASCVIRFDSEGSMTNRIELPASQITCPALGGDDLRTLYVTSARDGLDAAALVKEPHAGGVFAVRVDIPGIPEHQVQL